MKNSIILSWQQIPSTVISELLCQSDLDGVVIDTEHGCFSNEVLYSCIQVITLSGKKCLVRLSDINKTLIKYCLDAGADGLIFSTVETEEQARNIHDFCKYPSFGGRRGLGLVRENKWGMKSLFKKPPILIAQIETTKGIKNINNIASCGFDFYMIGPYDLSASLGAPGHFDSKIYLNAVESVKQLVSVEKMAVHIPTNIKKELKKYENYGIIAVGMDTTILLSGYEKISKEI